MDRRTFIGTIGSGLLACNHIADAQPTSKVWRIGVLTGNARPPDGAVSAPLRKALQALGYGEGKEIAYEGRWGEAHNERLPTLAAELVAANVDVIVTFGGPSAAAAKQASSSIPVIVVNGGDMVDTGLVASLARPGGNVTGVNDPAAVLSAKRLEILKEVVPAAKRVAVLWNAGDNAMTLRYREIEKAAEALRMSIDPLGVREPDDFDGALAAMSRRPDALMMVTDALTTLNRNEYRLRRDTSNSCDVRVRKRSPGRRVNVLWHRPGRNPEARGRLHCHGSPGCEAGGSARGAAEPVLSRH